MNEGMSKQILCVYDSKELCPIFKLLTQGNYHNLEGGREERKGAEESGGWERKERRKGGEGRQKKC